MTLVGQVVVPADNVQITENIKQIVPTDNTGTDRLIQLLFCRGSTGHKIGGDSQENSVIEYHVNARQKTGGNGFPLPPAPNRNGSDANTLLVFHTLNDSHGTVEQELIMLNFCMQLIVLHL